MLSKAELRAIMVEVAEEAADRAVRKTLTGLGVDVDHPLEMQRDFQSLRECRRLLGSARSKVLLTILGLAIMGILAAAANGIKKAVFG